MDLFRHGVRDGALRTAHEAALVAFAALTGLFEGPAEIACVLALATTAFTGRLSGWRPGLHSVGLLLWGLAGVPGLVSSEGNVSSQEASRPLLALAYVVGARGVPRSDARLFGRLAAAFVVACVANGAYGYLQLAFGELPLDALLLKNPKSTQIWVPDHIGGIRGVSGLFYHRLKLAHVGIVSLALLGMIAESGEVSPRKRLLAIAGLVILGGAVILTYARSAWVALILATLVTGFVSKSRFHDSVLPRRANPAGIGSGDVARSWRRLVYLLGGIGVLAIGGLAGAGAFVRERFQAIGGDLSIRMSMFDLAISVFCTHPIRGVGHGMYREAASLLAPPEIVGVLLTSPHNLALHVLAETGLVGFAGFTIGVLGALLAVGRRLAVNRATGGGAAMLDRLAFWGVLAVLLLGAAHSPLHHAPVALVFWTLLGVAEGSGRIETGPESERKTSVSNAPASDIS